MKRALVLATILLAAALPGLAGLITGVTITASSTFSDMSWDLAAVHMVDGSGLTDTASGLAHGTCYANHTCWQGTHTAAAATLTFDLGADYNLGSLHVWNGYWGNYESGRGASSVEIFTLTTGPGYWIDRGAFQFEEAPTSTESPYLGFDITAGWTGTRYIRFDIGGNYGGGSCGGCTTVNEVRFFSADAAVPEPSTLLLVAGALAALRCFRRRAV
jgi:hypothetical protein